MPDVEEQLAQLRQRMAAIDRKYQDLKRETPVPVAPRPAVSRTGIEEWYAGQEIENEHGTHFQMEKLYESHRRHGSADIGAMCCLPQDLLDVIGNGEISAAPPERWAFLDTETTGLAGGSGTYAFLIGVGRITPEGFRVRQFFMREYKEERSLLTGLTKHLEDFDVLVTYNGKTYDQPLLETRYRMSRQKPPFGRMQHLDLLHGTRRLWKLRFASCKLTFLENQVLGVEREGDLPGEMIPYVYFDYLRRGEPSRLIPIFHHNAIDILTLACLTAIVPSVFRDTSTDALAALGVRKGEEFLGLGRWLISADEHERGLELLRRAIETGLPDTLLFRTLWDIARLEKKLKRVESALSILEELSQCRNAHQAMALEELAKHYEHTGRNYQLALKLTRQALDLCNTETLRKRATRLEARLAKARDRSPL